MIETWLQPLPLYGRYAPVALIKLVVDPLLAERFGADNGRIARIISLSTDG